MTIVVEDAGSTLEALTTGDTDYDGWLTFEPWPAVVGEGRPAQPLGGPTPALASSELVIAELASANPCEGAGVDWKCLGETGADVGMPPRSTGLGLLLVGNAASGYFGRVDIATNDFEEDQDFDGWLTSITANSGDDDPLAQMLRFFPTKVFDAVGTTGGQFDTEVVDSRAEDGVARIDPDPLARANIVIAPVAGSDDADRVGDLAGNEALLNALVDAGWESGVDEPANLPSAGVLYQLRDR